MARQVLKKWGNSTAVRLPAAVMEAANLAVDQAVDVRAEHGRVIIEAAAPIYLLDDLLEGITPENRHGEVDTGAPQGKELL
ncbi:AbrB/MazE/SpoVT family DNA-binding domain-containing protein [Pseudoduganella aquatica]|uniref:AbrB/MazE/SpoVT family DNA-binding domain-containing protein n=1 Tax=Pseudoduganella aquatica TaxID=2660641 RepID=A0A7X4KJG6_9BURK|nr:AbrB/MazE/SpoVT family DNA-binding domain-containing protein [Pseudoduganella aquatica]MYN06009.1 AbrB/MazE/SpoVT family DNA-binding domain-containing protein [Pseudoduganella aquatica]